MILFLKYHYFSVPFRVIYSVEVKDGPSGKLRSSYLYTKPTNLACLLFFMQVRQVWKMKFFYS